MRERSFIWIVGLFLCLLPIHAARADELYGRIRGKVTDPSGAVIAGAQVTATSLQTGLAKSVTSGADGSYEIIQLPAPADYKVSANQTGFSPFETTSLHLSLDQIYVLDISLSVGAVTQEVTVEANAAQIEQTSIELGSTVNSRSIVDLPLNGRNWVQLQQLEPGVVAASDGRGNYATNGSQADQNSYLINGTDNNDFPLNTVSVTPSPDAIAEFKMVTNTINPEYGRNSGAILNAIIKSGTNGFHGDGFNFYRDTSLNARNFFAPSPAVFHRNEFGGTLGGPIRKDKTFFFFSYQGNRQRRPENTNDCGCASPGASPVFTTAQRNGAFPDLATSSNKSAFPLVGDNGTMYPANTPYSTIFSQGTIPTADFNSVSATLLSKFVPQANVGSNFEFNPVFKQLDDQYLGRVDHSIGANDTIWAYWLWERESDNATIPFTGATVPGFNQIDAEHWQQYTVAWNHTFNPTTLNEARLGYTRFNFLDVAPATPTAPSSVGFNINPQLASGEGIPVVNVLGLFSLGFSTNGPQPRIDQTRQATDNFSKVSGNHSLKAGVEIRWFQVYNPFSHINDGVFNFNHNGLYSTGDAGADFLLGIPDSYTQGSGDILNERTQEYYSYFQDQWKARRNLTLTYGVGWSIDTPAVDNYHNNHAGVAFRPGQQSTIFPTAPGGYVFQGDKGVNAFGTTHYKDFGPRFGFVYSPDWGKLTGGPGKTSIRAGFGIYFNRFNGETALQTEGSPPYALTSSGINDANASNPALPPLSPSFVNPFVDVAGKFSLTNKFPYAPSGTPNFSAYLPLLISVYDPNINVPYSENFNFTVERQVSQSTIFRLGYVGAVGRHEILPYELNPGINPAGCAANPVCAANPGLQPVLFPNNYKYPGNIFGSIGDVATVGTSNYNSLQASMERHFSHGLQFLVAYTWGKSLDNGSGFENAGFGGGGFGGFGELRSINPFNRNAADYGPSSYDATHRLVINYDYALPSVRRFNSLHWLPSRLTDGWQLTGITTLQSGFPLDVVDSSFPSLTSSFFTFYSAFNTSGWDVPNQIGPVQYVNPRSNPNSLGPGLAGTNYWFNPLAKSFGAPTVGTEGNAARDLFRGPGLNNFDFALLKETRITESTRIELRFEFFNIFNHTQFDPVGITTDFNSPQFGTETAAHDPRVIQLAGKLYF